MLYDNSLTVARQDLREALRLSELVQVGQQQASAPSELSEANTRNILIFLIPAEMLIGRFPSDAYLK